MESLRVALTARDIAIRECASHAETLRATIARVRETVARHQRIYAGSRDDGVPVQVILQALGGER